MKKSPSKAIEDLRTECAEARAVLMMLLPLFSPAPTYEKLTDNLLAASVGVERPYAKISLEKIRREVFADV